MQFFNGIDLLPPRAGISATILSILFDSFSILSSFFSRVGNAGAAWQRAYYVEALELLGYRVVLAEYPGYDGRAGSPSEAALVADGIASVEQIYQRYGEPIVLWGESVGSGVAAAVARQSQVPLAGLVLLTPWDSLP